MAVTRFANEYELQKVVQRCHNILWERHGFDPAQAFDEFSKLLFIKLYDEATMAGARTTIQRQEPVNQFTARIRWLFQQANQTPGFEGGEIGMQSTGKQQEAQHPVHQGLVEIDLA